MSDIFLVRHGQVAFDSTAYNGLSPAGERQAEALGRAFSARGVTASRVVVGDMFRQQQTAEIAGRAAGWSTSPEVDAGWDEFDHVALLAAMGDLRSGDSSLSGPDTLTRFFGEAIPRWSSGLHDGDYEETFDAFSERVTQTLGRLAGDPTGDDTTVVFTSSGVIGRIAASLLDTGAQQWLALIPVGINTGVTRLRVTEDEVRLVSYNEHAHLGPDLVTYR